MGGLGNGAVRAGRYGVRPHVGMVEVLKQQGSQRINELSEIRSAASRLKRITDKQIAAALAPQPIAWGVTVKQRVVLMRYLQQRRDQLAMVCLA